MQNILHKRVFLLHQNPFTTQISIEIIAMKYFSTTCCLLLLALVSFAQTPANFWKEVSYEQIFLPENAETVDMPANYRLLSLDFDGIRNYLRNAPAEGTPNIKEQALPITLPMPDGRMETFKVWESSVMAPELAAKYPMIKTYAGQGVDNPHYTLRMGTGLDGFHAVILAEKGGSIISRYATNQTKYYLNYSKSDIRLDQLNLPPELIKVVQMESKKKEAEQIAAHKGGVRGGGDGELVERRDYRFALACTGEYGQTHGGTVPTVLSTLVTAANTLNSVVGRDADMRLVLIPNNDQLVFLDPTTDPYNNANMGTALLSQNEQVLNQIVGLSSFDVGHVYTGPCSDVGGVVSGSVCSAGKARGVTCNFGSNVVGTTLSIAAHEMGHQFSAGHTFNNCPGSEGQHHAGSAYEPGSGSTILSYQGACGSNNIPGPSQVHYHGGTVEEYWIYTHYTGGNICPLVTTTNNHAPAVSLPYTDGFYIPIGTPFELEAIASDEDGDAITYCWEQMDLGPVSQLGTPIASAPSFRSWDPTTTPVRTFPKMSTVLSNGSDITEVLPTYSRDFTFRVTVRDNNMSEDAGGITWQDVKFKATDSAGPFKVTYPNSNLDNVQAGQQVTVTWDVANTDNNKVNCQSVNILLSVNGGSAFNIPLAISTPNDGSETVFIPDVTTSSARIRIEAADNIFFDVSNQNFSIEPADEPGLAFSFAPQFQQVCVPDIAEVTINTQSILNFDQPVSFEIIDGLPADVQVSFSANPVMPGESTTLTADMTGVADDGSFTATLQTIAGGDTILSELYFNIVNNDFTALALEGPADGESGLGVLPEFSWTDLPQADVVNFQLSTTPFFAPDDIVEEAYNLTDSYYVPTVGLDENTVYYWRIQPGNECGLADFTLPATFQTRTVTCTPFVSSDVPKSISAIGTPTVSSVLPIISSGTISDINVSKLKGTHDALPHIAASLVSPSGTEVVLFSGICGNTQAFDLGLDDEAAFDVADNCPPINGIKYRPQNPLAAFKGENTLGEWTMNIKVINNDGQGGTFEAWGVEFCASIEPEHPFIVKNDTMPVPPLDTRTLYNIYLNVQDADDVADDLQFTIVVATKDGYIARDGVQLGVGDHFTMRDIHQERITYTNTNPDALFDFFTFIVQDDQGGFMGTPKFNIVIDPDAPVATNEALPDGVDLVIFPNPASNLLRLALTEPLDERAYLQITDLRGSVLWKQPETDLRTAVNIDVSDLPNGLYLLQLRTNSGAIARKFTVMR